MRNLKKVLSLSLALVMLLGMMVVGAGAAPAFNDVEADSDKAEAIGVMSAIKILEGKGEGNFDPEGTLTRAEAAAIIAKVYFTPDTLKVMVGFETRFTDVAEYEGGWAIPYVQACANEGIIKGDDATHFAPDRKVNGIEFAAFLLRMLKISVDESDHETWAFNIWQAAHAAKLDANDVVISTAELSREDAAQMAFNALNYTEKGQETGEYKLTAKTAAVASLDGIVFGSRTEAVLVANAVNGSAVLGTDYELTAVKDNTGSLAVDVYKLSDSTYTDGLGHTYKTWMQAGKTDPIYVSANPISSAKVTYTTDVTADQVKKDTGAASTAIDRAKVFVNGAALGATGTNVNVEDQCANGKIVEVYTTGKTITKVNVINKKFAVLAANPVTASNGNISISSIGMANVKPENIMGVDVSDLAKGDVVLFVKDAESVWHIEKLAPAFTGKVSGNHTTKGALIDGQYYQATGLGAQVGSTVYTGPINDDKEYDFYLDDGGAIVYAKAVTDGTADESNYAVVLQTSWVLGRETGVIGETGTKGYLQAKILKTDGTTEVVTVATIDGAAPIAAGTTLKSLNVNARAYSNSNGTLSSVYNASTGNIVGGTQVDVDGEDDNDTAIAADEFCAISDVESAGAATKKTSLYLGVTNTAGSESTKVPADRFYSYTVNPKGEYVLSTAAAGTDTLANMAGTHDLENGKVLFDGTNIGNANTLFIYEITTGSGATEKKEYKTFTGIADAPTVDYDSVSNKFTNHNGSNVIVKSSGGVAKLVFVKTTGTTTAAGDVIYVLSGDKVTVSGMPATYIHDAVVNGEVTTITTTNGSVTAGFYTGATNDKGVYTTLTSQASADEVGIVSNEAGVLMTNGTDGSTATPHGYEDGTPAFIIAEGVSTPTTVEALAPDASDLVYVKTDANGKVETVYVVTKSSEPGNMTVTISDTTNGAITSNPSSASGNLVAGKVTVAQAAADKTVTGTVTVTLTNGVARGVTYSITVDGAGTNVTHASAAVYTLVDGDANKSLKVTLTATDDYSGVVDVYEYTITVGALKPAAG